VYYILQCIPDALSHGSTKIYRFEFNPSFNQHIGQWETKSLQVFERMFFNASSFEQSLCWEINDVPSPSFQVFCNSGGRFNQFCVDKDIVYNANRRCTDPLEDWLQDWIDFINHIIDIINDIIDCITNFFGQIGDIFVCFAPEAMTRVENRGVVAMKDLQVGDKVLTGSGRYQPVYSMFHYDRTKPTPYLQIHSSHSRNGTGARPLELTANHMLHVVGYENPIPAWQVQVGDYVYIMEPLYPTTHEAKDPWALSIRRPQQLQQSQVVEIRQVVRHGLYNPLTEDGTIVVDNIVTSAYASFLGTEHIRLFRTASALSVTTSGYEMGSDDGWKVMSHQSFVHMLLAPYRAVCLHVYPNGCQPSDDGHDDSVWYGRLGQNLLTLWLRQHVVIQAIIFVILMTVFGFMDLILNPVGFSVALTLLVSCVLSRRTSLLSEPQSSERMTRTCKRS
jgi:Hint module/Mycoplasma protein of unknown function, DUF285